MARRSMSMIRRFHVSFSLLAVSLASAGVLFAQSRPATAPATAPAATPSAAPAVNPAVPAGDLKIVLMDGSIVSGKLSVADLAIDTKFGMLKVPIDQIQSFAPGLQSHPKFQQNLMDNINNLAADAFADREKAQAELTKLGPDIRGELEREVKSAEAEKQMRLQKIIDDFDGGGSDEEIDKSTQWVDDDVIVTPGFTVVGHITTPSFSVSNQYGTLQLKLEDIRRGHRDALEPEEIHKTLSVNGTAITQHAFTNTSIHVERGDKIYVTASGSIQLTPWGNNAQSTPDGAVNGNLGMQQPGNLPGGSLIGKIGDGSAPFRLGSKATITADHAGTLELGVACGGDYSSYQFPGEYQVRIRVVKKVGQ